MYGLVLFNDGIYHCTKLNNIKRQENGQYMKNFLSLFAEDFANSVNKTVEENQLERKRQRKIILPSKEDIRLLNSFLNKEREAYFHNLKSSVTSSNWKALAEVTLTSIQLFNRRRAGEIERLTIADFLNHETIDQRTNLDIFNSLSEESKLAAKQYYRFEIRGKLGRNVPVLLHLNHLRAIELLNLHREDVGVSKQNPYVFGIPGGDQKFLRACHLLRKFSVSCGAKQPSTLRGTQLRKQIATQSVLLDLADNEVTDLANFMGHDEKIHKDHYRLPIVTRDIVRMSRLLELAQGGVDDDMEAPENLGDVSESVPESRTGNQEGKEYVDEIEPGPSTAYSEEILEARTVTGVKRKKQSETEPGPSTVDSQEILEAKMNEVIGGKRKKRSVSPVGYVSRRSWSEDERRQALKLFGKSIERNSLPSIDICEDIIHKYPVFSGRSPMQMKAWISNQIIKNKKPEKRRKRGVTNYWSNEEKRKMFQIFGNHLRNKILPGFQECREVIQNNPELKSRSVQTIKAWVNNQIKKKRINEFWQMNSSSLLHNNNRKCCIENSSVNSKKNFILTSFSRFKQLKQIHTVVYLVYL